MNAVLLCGTVWAALVLYLLSRALRQFRAYRATTLPPPAQPAASHSVSIIVPVRNEIENIALCLEGLRAQTGLCARPSIIVVDDDSQDGTAAAVKASIAGDPSVQLADAGALPEGWIGKPHACWRGALLADSEWLCFIDADLRAAPDLVAAALTAALAQRIDMLSLHPLQELGSFWERLIIPAGLLVLACAKPFRPDSQEVVNGQFLLIRREVYFDIGGHRAVRAEIAEDKMLAARVRSAGYSLRVLMGEEFARTRMYRNFGSLWEGLSKNVTEVLGGAAATLSTAAAVLVLGWTAMLLPPSLAVAAFGEPSPAAAIGVGLALFGSAVAIGIQCGTARHFRIPAAYGLALTLGCTAVACLACHGVLAHLTGRVAWKGRIYRLAKTAPERG